MTMQTAARIICRTAAGAGSLFVSLYGLYAYAGLNLNLDTLPISLYCFVPMLFFPVFLLSFWRQRLSAVLHVVMAMLFLVVYSMLNWRTCAELDYCRSVAATVLQTLATRPVESAFAVAIFNLAALRLARPPRPAA
jgi:hypothetical protein